MDNLEKITEMYQEIDIILRNKCPEYATTNRVKGYYMPDKGRIEIYPKNILDNEDYDITLIHESLHHLYPNLSEENVEFSAKQLNKVNKDYVNTIKFIYDLPKKIK